MGDNYFELIAQALLEQQHLMEQLMQENQELRRQLAELRAGKGISIIIGDQQIAMGQEALLATPVATAAPGLAPQDVTASSIGAAATARAEAIASTQEPDGIDLPSFLEEIMLDEFAAAMTNPVATVSTPPKKAEKTEDEQKADLRRDLMGSYVLE